MRALRDKYERMLALRTAHARAAADPSFAEPNPRPDMAQLSADYPGVLREIDTLAFDVIGERIVLLARAELDSDVAELWMSAQVHFHGFTRGALLAKRWLAGRKPITPELRLEFAAAAPGLGEDAVLVVDDLEAVAAPPRGRLTAYAFAKVADLLGLDVTEVRRLVFPPRR